MSDKKTELTKPAKAEPLLFGMVGGKELRIPVIGLCGDYGSGKTLAGLTLDPQNTTEIAIEDSDETYHIPLAKRYSMYSEVKTKSKDGIPTSQECFEWFYNILPSIDTRILFIDPITDIQQGMVDWVESHPERFGKTKNQYEKASGLLWGDVKAFVKSLLGRMSKRVECVIFTAHMGTVWKDGKPVPGKKKAKGLDVFKELASLYVHLSRPIDPASGKQPDIPVGHVCEPHGKSRLAHTVLQPDGSVKIQAILPPRIEKFTWDTVRKYIANPPDFAKLKKSEMAEVEKLSEDDKLLLRSDIADKELEAQRLRQELSEKATEAARRNAAASKAKDADKEDSKVQESPAAETTPQQETETSAPFEVPEEKVEVKPQPKKEEKPVEKPAESSEAPTPAETREQKIAKVKEMAAQCLTPEGLIKSVNRRGGKDTVESLNDEQLEEMRRALWSKLTQKDMQAKK